MLAYFNPSLLAKYRERRDIYEIVDDGLEVRVRLRSSYADSLSEKQLQEQYFEARFGWRLLCGGDRCLVVFGPDLAKLPDAEKRRWYGYLLHDPAFASQDGVFEDWRKRYLEGSWDVESGIITRIQRVLQRVNALARAALSHPLFQHDRSPFLGFPAAENAEAYRRAHEEVHRLLIDGLNRKALTVLAVKLGLPRKGKRLDVLGSTLPQNIREQVMDPLTKCSEVRNRTHLLEQPQGMNASAEFQKDLEALEAGLAALRDWFAGEFGLDADACLERDNAMASLFPVIEGPPRPESKLEELRKAEGKTIERVEYGVEEQNPSSYEAEGLILHFTDGSSLCVRAGCNIENIASACPSVKPSDLSIDFMVFWAPSVKGVSSN